MITISYFNRKGIQYLMDSNKNLLSFDNEDEAITFIQQGNKDILHKSQKRINLSSCRISYDHTVIPRLPEFLAHPKEEGSGDFVILDSETGENLINSYTIVFVDANSGYFVYYDILNEEYRIINNKNLIIYKNDYI